MYNIDKTLPLFNRTFTDFALALRTMENELHGEPTVVGVRFLWEECMEEGEVFLGETNHGPLYITVVHTPRGTTYSATFGNPE